MAEMIEKADTATLWAVATDLSEIMQLRGYKPDRNNECFMLLYHFFKVIETEINARLCNDYGEG